MRPASPPRAARSFVLGTAFLVVGASACATAGIPPSGEDGARPLRARVDALLEEAPFDRVHWGVLAVDATSERPLYERNADLLFIPASNTKLPVAAAAMDLLGEAFRWRTSFYSHSLPADGVLDGDLYLVAGGDPTLGRPFHDSADAALGALADSLLAAGVRRVSGRLLVDVSAWDSTTVPESWMMEDLNGTAGATGGALSVGRGEIEIRVRGVGRAGEAAAVEWEPRGPAVDDDAGATGAVFRPFVEHRVETVAADVDGEVRARFLPESRRWIVEGEIRSGELRTLARSSRDPVRLAVAALARALDDRGLEVAGGYLVLWDRDVPVERSCASGRIPSCAEMLRVAGLPSPPLSEVVAEILGPSQNWTAEQLIRTIGAELGEEGSWDAGFEVVGSHLASTADVGPEEIYFEDGSGLSNHNLVSPRALVSVFDHARRQPWGSTFRSALARPGAEETTLSDRLAELEGRVFAKTGSLNHVNALSGYLVADDGRELIFSILSNGSNLPAGGMRERIDALVGELARLPR